MIISIDIINDRRLVKFSFIIIKVFKRIDTSLDNIGIVIRISRIVDIFVMNEFITPQVIVLFKTRLLCL